MVVKQILDKLIGSPEMILRVYKVDDYGNENSAQTVYPMAYVYEIPSRLPLGDYEQLLKTEVKGFLVHDNIGLHIYV